jgi:A/G-specific adenine glycosylase
MTTSGPNEYAAFRSALRKNAQRLERPLPWIGHPSAWAILVSEVMLQQTQVSRVLGPWERFLHRFPDPTSCANAPLASVLREWEGLGYHRRARALHQAAQRIRDHFGGEVPDNVDDLRSLAGVGEYTANAVASFAFGHTVAVLDTNVGRVLARALANRPLRHREARELAEKLLPSRESASFNQALLDLGAQFCRSTPLCESCPVARACRWHQEGGEDPAPSSAAVSRPQSTFQGSDRQVRGQILGLLRAREAPLGDLLDVTGVDSERLTKVVEGLLKDGLIQKKGARFELALS